MPGRRAGSAALALLAALPLPPLLGPPGSTGGPAVYAFPGPDARDALPQTQIAFRGAVPIAASIQVRGSVSGIHAGVVRVDSDGLGASFIPTSGFSPGETVTVTTPLDVVGGHGGSYQFRVAEQAPLGPFPPRIVSRHVRGGVERFRSRPDLAPAAIRIIRNTPRTAPGDLFIAPESSPVQAGPEIRDRGGRLIWYEPMPKNQYASDFRVQRLRRQPVLTWWQGYVQSGIGFGDDVILDDRYRTLAVVRALGGAEADLHEFLISREGTALITAYYPVWWDERPSGGPARAYVFDSIVQEIDLATGLLLFEWHALDHVALGDSYLWSPRSPAPDYFHANSIQELADGSLLISARNTWTAYDVDRLSGAILWQLGGKRSSFRIPPGASFAFQHDVELHAHNVVSLFDDGAGPPAIHGQSRALGLRLDFRAWRARRAFSLKHHPRLLAYFQGNAQRLPDGHYLIGWGLKPFLSEFTESGRELFDARLVCGCFNYRAYRFRWSAVPTGPPALAVERRGRRVTVYASWNGATGIGFWRVLGGSRPDRLRPLRRVRASGFETAISVRAARYLAVVALDALGRRLSGSSRVVRG